MAEAVGLNEVLENVGFGCGRRLLIIRGKAERTKRPALQGVKGEVIPEIYLRFLQPQAARVRQNS
jgi:hypothetical protein